MMAGISNLAPSRRIPVVACRSAIEQGKAVRDTKRQRNNAHTATLKQSVAALSLALILQHQPMDALAADCPEFTTISQGEAKGLQWCDVKIGEGDSPVPKAFVKAHYTGSLDSEMASGVFDSSYDRRKPLGFMVGTHQVISGWDLGILGDGSELPPMRAGGIRKLVLPPNLAYGERGAGGVIPPNATLYFDIEYLGRLGKK